jgi:hypothetical protein
VPSVGAAHVIRDGAAAFFSASIKEMLATPGIHQFSRTSFPAQGERWGHTPFPLVLTVGKPSLAVHLLRWRCRCGAKAT